MASYILLGLAATPCAHAWGALGHATVAYVAQNYVDPEVATWAQGILNDSSSSYLASIASWADDYRSTAAGKFSAPFHYIDAEDSPPSACNLDYERDCGPEGCVVSAVANYTQRLGDGRLPTLETQQALKFLVHFIGDMTQPLHNEAIAVGGNNIKTEFNGASGNLHGNWDTAIPQKLIGGGKLTDAQGWANTLIKDIESGIYKNQSASWVKGDNISEVLTTATRWAADANALVCTVVLPNGAEVLETGDLYPSYYNGVIDTVELQIAKGGYRLAYWLNQIYGTSVSLNKRWTAMERRNAPQSLNGREFLPQPRPLSKAKLAREAMGGSCNCDKHSS